MTTMKTTSLAPGAADVLDDVELARRIGSATSARSSC